MKHNFKRSYIELVKLEGGFTLHTNPSEETETYAGIYRKANPRWIGWRDIDEGRIPNEELVENFYRTWYWEKCNCDNLPDGLDFSVFQFAVVSGVGNSGKVLQRVLGFEGNTVDGIIGSKTLAAVHLWESCSDKFRELTCLLTGEHIDYYYSLPEHKQELFIDGWRNRAIKADRIVDSMSTPF